MGSCLTHLGIPPPATAGQIEYYQNLIRDLAAHDPSNLDTTLMSELLKTAYEARRRAGIKFTPMEGMDSARYQH